MTNPSVHLISGDCSTQLNCEVKPGANNTAVFAKTALSLRGSVGVFTYDLFNTNEKMAVMFSVPFNFNFYENVFAVGVFSSNTVCDYDLYNTMYYKQPSGFVRGKAKDSVLTHEGKKVVIKASMSDSYRSTLRVNVNEIV
ncbi:unnamed protein product [Lota lota]